MYNLTNKKTDYKSLKWSCLKRGKDFFFNVSLPFKFKIFLIIQKKKKRVKLFSSEILQSILVLLTPYILVAEIHSRINLCYNTN